MLKIKIRFTLFHALVTFAITSLLACSGQTKLTERIAPAMAKHHRADGYQNNYVEFQPKGMGKVLQWQWRALLDGLPRSPGIFTPEQNPDLAFLKANENQGTKMEPTVTWVGHSTVLVQMGGLNILTDPLFSDRASPIPWLGPKRAQAPGLTLEQLPHIDVVLISHNHYDHCDQVSLLALDKQTGAPPIFLVPLGLGKWFNKIGIRNTVELDWWQNHKIAGSDFVFTPVQHWSGRSLTDRMKTLWGGFAVFAPDFHLFFAGDTGYSKDFDDISRYFSERQKGDGFDIALIPIGAYEPRWFMNQEHVNPSEAVQIHKDLRAKLSIGIHWGTFEMTDEALDAPPLALKAALENANLSQEAFLTLAIGETRKLQRRNALPNNRSKN